MSVDHSSIEPGRGGIRDVKDVEALGMSNRCFLVKVLVHDGEHRGSEETVTGKT